MNEKVKTPRRVLNTNVSVRRLSADQWQLASCLNQDGLSQTLEQTFAERVECKSKSVALDEQSQLLFRLDHLMLEADGNLVDIERWMQEWEKCKRKLPRCKRKYHDLRGRFNQQNRSVRTAVVNLRREELVLTAVLASSRPYCGSCLAVIARPRRHGQLATILTDRQA